MVVHTWGRPAGIKSYLSGGSGGDATAVLVVTPLQFSVAQYLVVPGTVTVCVFASRFRYNILGNGQPNTVVD